MDVFAAISGRRSIRSYMQKDVEEEKIQQILEAGRLSPSASNRQEWKFIVVRDEEKRRRLAAAACGQAFVGEAPVVLVACATESSALMPCGHPPYIVDLSIAFAYMLLQAFELGLGTCWIGAFNEQAVKEILGVPRHVRVMSLSPVGYAKQAIPQRPRKRLDQIVCLDGYQ